MIDHCWNTAPYKTRATKSPVFFCLKAWWFSFSFCLSSLGWILSMLMQKKTQTIKIALTMEWKVMKDLYSISCERPSIRRSVALQIREAFNHFWNDLSIRMGSFFIKEDTEQKIDQSAFHSWVTNKLEPIVCGWATVALNLDAGCSKAEHPSKYHLSLEMWLMLYLSSNATYRGEEHQLSEGI